jgi:hypothetical protein
VAIGAIAPTTRPLVYPVGYVAIRPAVAVFQLLFAALPLA